MRAPLLALVALLALPAAAQQTGAGGTGKQSYKNLRSFTIENNSSHPLAGVTLLSTDGTQMFQTNHPIQPNEASEAQVGSNQCLAEVDVTFKGGRTMSSKDLHDCKLTRVSISDQGIKLESAAVQ